MRFKNGTVNKITTKELAVCLAIDAIYAQQGLSRACELLSLKPLVFNIDINISKAQQQRLFADAVAYSIDGYYGEINGVELVVQEKATKPIRAKRKGSSKSNRIIQSSTGQDEMDQQVSA